MVDTRELGLDAPKVPNCRCKHDAHAHTTNAGTWAILQGCSKCVCIGWSPKWHDKMRGEYWR